MPTIIIVNINATNNITIIMNSVYADTNIIITISIL